MKKEVILILLLILVPSVFAENSSNLQSNLNNLTSLNISNEANKALATEVKIPDNIKPIARILFGIKEDMPFSKFVVYLMIWLIIFLIIFQTVKIMPFFRQGPIKFIAALAISILAGNLGGIEAVVNLYYDLSIAKFIDAASPGAFVLIVIVLITLYFLISKIVSKIAISLEKGNIDSSATEAGTGYRVLRIISNTFMKKNKD